MNNEPVTSDMSGKYSPEMLQFLSLHNRKKDLLAEVRNIRDTMNVLQDNILFNMDSENSKREELIIPEKDKQLYGDSGYIRVRIEKRYSPVTKDMISKGLQKVFADSFPHMSEGDINTYSIDIAEMIWRGRSYSTYKTIDRIYDSDNVRRANKKKFARLSFDN